MGNIDVIILFTTYELWEYKALVDSSERSRDQERCHKDCGI
jgi:hypothetical protein